MRVLGLLVIVCAELLMSQVRRSLQAVLDEVSFADMNLAAAEGYLFGRSVTFDIEINCEFSLKAAISHLNAAFKAGNGEAAFYLEMLLEQSLLVEDLDSFLPDLPSFKVTSQSLFESAKQHQSHLLRSSLATTYYKCLTSSPVSPPKILIGDSLHFYESPFFGDSTCGGTCSEMIVHSAQEASLQLSKRNHGQLSVPHLEELWNTQKVLASIQESIMPNTPKIDSTLSLYGLPPEYLTALEALPESEKLSEALKALVNTQDSTSLVAMSEIATRLNSGELLQQQLAFQLFLHLAELGHLESQVNVGLFYLRGQVVPANYDLAYKYLSLAAASKHPEALYNLALMHLEGLGTHRDCRTALELFHLVTEQILAASITTHGNSLYAAGDKARAYFNYVLAAALGFESAQISAGVMFKRSESPMKCRKDWQHCMSNYLMLSVVQHQSQWSLNKLGDLAYARVDYEEAFYYYNSAQSSPEALFSLAMLYEYGLGIHSDTVKAWNLYSEIIARAYESEFEKEAEYPAQLALMWLRLKCYLFSYYENC